MTQVLQGNPEILSGLDKLCTEKNAIQHTEDSFGNNFYWYRLNYPDQILEAAKLLYSENARLAMITAYNDHKNSEKMHNACYEFVLNGVVYNITAHMDKEHPSVPSIARIFLNADWHEREMMELYGIEVTNHPNPRRLFLDEELDKGLLGEIVPLSIMMNGASSSDLWEMILADKEKGHE